MLPNSTPKASKETIVQMLLDNKLWTNKNITKLSLVAVRGYYLDSMGKPGKNDRGIYDDAIFLLSPECFASFNANTDPSRFRSGIASLKAPQQVTYKPGYHGYGRRSGHSAFRQLSDVIVKRDSNVGNGTPLGDGLFLDKASNRFWINLHRGGINTTSSEGCLTVTPTQWRAFYALVRTEMKKWNQTTFVLNIVENKS